MRKTDAHQRASFTLQLEALFREHFEATCTSLMKKHPLLESAFTQLIDHEEQQEIKRVAQANREAVQAQ